MVLDRSPTVLFSAPDAHVLSRPRGRCREVRRRHRALVALVVLSTLAVAALGARFLLAVEAAGL